MRQSLRRFVAARAGWRCEYCRLPDGAASLAVFHIEHIIAKQHRGTDHSSNRCYCCHRCNFSKGPNLSGIDPVSGEMVALFHPRRQSWSRHFRWKGAVLLGRTKTGRATIAVLDINHPQRVELRRQLIALNEFPIGGDALS